ncbi:MAG: penicillin-insensitive murein endopeptidase [Thiohalocapsa sp.]|nr:penicillin-insensitive murein endopeptidase [Thiohalocapsa sp.]
MHPSSFRRFRPKTFAATVILSTALAGSGALIAGETPWSRIQTVSVGAPAAIGGPSNGCIVGADALPAVGPGFVSTRRHRNRFYGHPRTVDMVRQLGEAMDRRNGKLIMVGDLAQPRGGRMSSSHVSHQNGLDVDIWMTLADSAATAVRSTPEERDPPSMLGANKLRLNDRWGPDQLFLIKAAAEHPAVDRILVNPGIKRALCQSENNAAWLRKLRPWWGHDAHMHVRLKCPKDSPSCRQQSPVPMSSGCGSELAWWFGLEANSPKKTSAKPAPRPDPPAACRNLIAQF